MTGVGWRRHGVQGPHSSSGLILTEKCRTAAQNLCIAPISPDYGKNGGALMTPAIRDDLTHISMGQRNGQKSKQRD